MPLPLTGVALNLAGNFLSHLIGENAQRLLRPKSLDVSLRRLFEVVHAIKVVADGANYYCDGVTDTIMNGIKEGKEKKQIVQEVKLTDRELDVLKLVAEGMKASEIADQLNIAETTVSTHRRNMMDKLNFNRATQLVAYAFKNGYTK